jgi:hypothetical protein
MKLFRFILAIGLLAGSIRTSLLAQNQNGMEPFAMDYWGAAQAQSPVDVSFLLDAPAGKHGFIQIKDGHLATGDGRRFRFWGVNITDWSPGSRQIPTKEDAAFWAAALARFGINAVRLQFLDLDAPRGLIKSGVDNSRSLDPEQLDREDYFIAQLEQRGIYIDFNLLVGRPFSEGDGVKDAKLLGVGAKGTSLYDTRLIELQKDYARELLGHLNPYTKLKYSDDPAIAVIEINNENSLYVAFHPPSPFYEEELARLYNRWLATHADAKHLAMLHALSGTPDNSPVPLLSNWGLGAKSQPARFLIESAFYEELERSYFDDMERYIKLTLGSKSLVIGTADFNHNSSGYPALLAMSSMDIIDGHDYWQHPGDLSVSRKSPMVNDPLQSTLVNLSRSAIADKPYMVSEVNEPFPNDYASEGIPILAAYGAFQDWDGIFWYTFEPKIDSRGPHMIGDAFDIACDPVKMPELAAGALLFLRGDVEQARMVRERSYTISQIFASILVDWSERPYFTEKFPLSLPLQHEVRIASQPINQPFDPFDNDNPIVSDTQQLAWYTSPQKGEVTVNSPRSQALIGFVREHRASDSNLVADVKNSFCAILLSSMDEQPIATSSRMLLVTGGRAEDTGQAWNSAHKELTHGGKPPTVAEPIQGTLTLRNIQHARAVSLQPLDGAGHPLGRAVSATAAGDDWFMPLGSIATTWYLITVLH